MERRSSGPALNPIRLPLLARAIVSGGAFDKPGHILYQAPMRPFSAFLPCAALWFSFGSLLAAESPATFKAGEFTFTRPPGWQSVETTSMMRKAQLKITDADKKESAEVVFFHFGEGGGGGIQANIDRWLAQFQEPKEKIHSKVEEVTVGQRMVTYVQADGTYLSGMPGGSKTALPNTMLLGAILHSDQGNVFIRFTGPVRLAQASQADFRKMVEGALRDAKHPSKA